MTNGTVLVINCFCSHISFEQKYYWKWQHFSHRVFVCSQFEHLLTQDDLRFSMNNRPSK